MAIDMDKMQKSYFDLFVDGIEPPDDPDEPMTYTQETADNDDP